MKLDYDGEVFTITCRFQDNYLLERLDRRWSKAKRHHRVYNARKNREILSTINFSYISPEAEEALSSSTSPVLEKVSTPLDPRLLPHQKNAVEKMVSLPCGFVNSPLGSGKTFIGVSIARTLFIEGEIDQVLVIALVSLKLNWEAEFEKWWPECPVPLLITGAESYSQGKQYDEAKEFVSRETLVLLDESNSIKTPTAVRSKRIVEVASVASRRYAMSGLPITQGLHDLFNQYLFLDRDIIGIKTNVGFRNRYCIMGGFKGKKIVGYRRQEELMDAIRPYTYKISTKECMPFLPEKTYTKIPVHLSKAQQKEIKEVKSTLTYNGENIENVLTLMLRIAQIAGQPDGGKTKALLALLENMDQDEQVVIFCNFLDEIHGIAGILPDYDTEIIYGEVNTSTRHDIVNRFQKGEFRYLICQYATASHGLNMDAARFCIYYSHTFNFGHRKQSEGRIARLTQKRPMVYYDLVAKGCTDALSMRALAAKQDMSDYVQDALESVDIENLF